MKSPARWKLPVLLLAIALVALQPVFAFQDPLSSMDIREAYFLGKGAPDKRIAFLAKYTRALPAPASGPYISVIDIETPYSIIVEHAAHALPNYFAPDAEQEFLGKPGVFRVHVRINLTASYSSQVAGADGGVHVRPDDFWKDFTVRVRQTQELSPQSVRGNPLYESSEDGGSWLVGARVHLEFDSEKMDPSTPAAVDVVTPDGQDVQTTFDLAELR